MNLLFLDRNVMNSKLCVCVFCFSIFGLNLLLLKTLLIRHGSRGGGMQGKLHIESVFAAFCLVFFFLSVRCCLASILYRISSLLLPKLRVEASSARVSGIRPMAHCCTGGLTEVSTTISLRTDFRTQEKIKKSIRCMNVSLSLSICEEVHRRPMGRRTRVFK